MAPEFKILFALYILAGLFFIIIENKLLQQVDSSNFSKTEKFIFIAHQLIHYIRMMLVWPLYVLEDFLIYIDVNINNEEE